MKSLISEFSYGFALTHELVNALGTLSAAPIFPSLIEEGRAGGGYDVKLEAPGIPLFLQFKRSECLERRSAREIKAGAPLDVPYYRFEVTGNADSDQHEMLIALDQGPNLVFYAAPMFFRKAEFDSAFINGVVRQRSFYIRPRSIGSFTDGNPHNVSFDGSRCVVMSEPKVIEAFGASELEAMFRTGLANEKRPVRVTIEEAVREAELAQSRFRERSQSKSSSVSEQVSEEFSSSSAELFKRRQEESVPSTPSSIPDDQIRAGLRKLADIGLREFNSQLYIVQARAPKK